MWRLIERTKVHEENLRNELASDRLAAETYRDIFLKHNKPWLQGQLHEIFTPRTLFVHRTKIIE